MKRLSLIIVGFLCIVATGVVFPLTVSADIGPKASVHIRFENMGDNLCYGTLLSKTESTGPNFAWDGDEEHIYNYDLDLDIWRAFVNYEDADGYHFLQIGWRVSETKGIDWNYYPPSSFKILLYYPETDKFVVSGIHEKYAFDTYYTVDMEGINISAVDLNEELSNDDRINAYRCYDFHRELSGLAARILITIFIEIGVALMLGIRRKRQLLLLVIVNAATQILLNLLLGIAISADELEFILLYLIFEAGIFAVEALLYCRLMNKYSYTERSRRYYIIYALVANAASFCAGALLAELIPSIF